MDPLLARITIDPEICHGKPCVRGLRYPVEVLLDLLGAGMSFDDVLADYDDLEPDDLRAVLAFAARLARSRRLEPVPTRSSWSTPSCRGGPSHGWSRPGTTRHTRAICPVAIERPTTT